ncbi:MAG: YHS domain-containing protein [Ignavibacteria bacterium]|nr:YHS domain-containing protein [Ignavibacteria bacterium]
MKTKLFLSVLALAMVAVAFMYGSSYGEQESCCCTNCVCISCTCDEGNCSGCGDNGCCASGNCAGGNCCKDMNKSGGVSGDSAVCVVSGEPLVKGKEVVLNYLGKDYSFCCDNCVTSFKNEPIKYIKDGLMCPVMNEPAKKNVYTVYEGTKYYFCCKMCIKEFEADANKYLKKEPKTDNN